ncbi:MAG: PEGA domain-containing protein [Candidatus Hydrothermarchaeaceae archaeon]
MKWIALFPVLLLLFGISAQENPLGPMDEIIAFETETDATIFTLFQYDGKALVTEREVRHSSTPTGWLSGDIDGDGIDEIIAFETETDATIFTLFQYDGKALVTEGEVRRSSTPTGWLLGDIDEALKILSFSPQILTIKPDEGEKITFSIEAEQSDGASLQYSWKLNGAKVAESKEWTYAPDYGAPGLYRITGVATDGKLSVSSEWNVDVGEFNHAPSVASLSPKSGEIIIKDVDIRWKAEDPDNDDLRIDIYYSKNKGNAWEALAAGEKNDGSFTWGTNDVNDGEYVLKIVARDPYNHSSENLSESFFIGNLPPIVEFVSPLPGEIGGIREISWQAHDPFERDISVVLSMSPGDNGATKTLATGAGNGSFSWDTTEVSDGRYLLTVTAVSPAGKSERTLTVAIKNPDYPDYGSFFVSSRPTGASVIIGGKDYGETRREVVILAGYHALEIKKDGYLPWTGWILVEEGENPEINVMLTPSLFGLPPAQIFAAALVILLIIFSLLIYRGRK